MENKLADFLKGKKTYIVAAVAAGVAVAQVLGYPIPEWVLTALGAAGLYGVRKAL